MTPLKGKKLTAIFSSQNTETIFTLYRHGGSFFTIRRLRSTARAKPLKLRQTGFFKDLFVAAYCHKNILSGLPMGANLSSGAPY